MISTSNLSSLMFSAGEKVSPAWGGGQMRSEIRLGGAWRTLLSSTNLGCQLGTCFVPGMPKECLSSHHPCSSPLRLSAMASLSHHLTSPPCRVYKNMEELRTRIVSGIIAPLGVPTEKAKKESQAEKKDPDSPLDYNPRGIPPRHPAGARAPSW